MNPFEQIHVPSLKRGLFDLSHEYKTTNKFGANSLIPILTEECLPGDKFTLSTNHLVKLLPMKFPIMHKVDISVHFFYVPWRIVWPDFEKFITGQEEILTPTAPLKNVVSQRLADYLGFPQQGNVVNPISVNLLYHYAYIKIFNDYYRDQDLQPEIEIESMTPSEIFEMECLNRAWTKDYFTSARPWAQKGDPVTIPAVVTYLNDTLVDSTTVTGSVTGDVQLGAYQNGLSKLIGQSNPGAFLQVQNIDEIALSLNELRYATRLQQFLETDARAGNRYVEHLLAHWGVHSSDRKLQRPAYIGGYRAPIVISEVLNQTEDIEKGNLLGNRGGLALSVGSCPNLEWYSEEYGVIMAICSLIPEANYCQGVPRKYLRLAQLDFPFPEFAQIGEQVVTNAELYVKGNKEVDNGEFGYQGRYAEMKYGISRTTGEFARVDEANGFMYWHLGRIFADTPQLNEEFIQGNPSDRVFYVADATNVIYSFFHKVIVARSLPYFNVPTI